ncbi:hypothetical protein B0I37DRAFT_156404 [Chaetomium sp. MPI-CAGE-AT-0009]|nr:hypothetical protein B0I37DRAFT_156404 [Chaetomium sp. MPI-CAGE-AT-0009]
MPSTLRAPLQMSRRHPGPGRRAIGVVVFDRVRAHPWRISRASDSSRSMGDPLEAPRLARRRQSGVGGRRHGHSIKASPRSPLSVTPLIRGQSSPLACPGVSGLAVCLAPHQSLQEPCIPQDSHPPLDRVCSLHLDLKSCAVCPPSSEPASVRQLGVPSPAACRSLAGPTG